MFVCACHHDGRIRERALRAAEGRRGRFVLGAALLRSSDAVAPVRAQARRLIDASLREDPTEMLELLDLALLLRRRRPRFEQGVWSEAIEPFLRAPARVDLRRAALAHRDGHARLWALQAVCALDPQSAQAALERALQDPVPAIGLHALRELHSRAEPAMRDALLAHMHELPHCVQRSEALRLIQRLGPADAQARLQDALFDPAFGPRRTAARLLRDRYGIDPAAIYRPALNGRDSERMRIALVALSPYATAGDLDALERMQDHPSSKVRKYALRGLAAADAPGLAARLRQAMSSPEPGTVDFAAKAFTRNHRNPDPDSLETAWRAHGWGLSRPLLRAARRLPRYDELAVLLSLLTQESEPWRRPPLQQALRRWCGRSRWRSAAQASVEQAPALQQALVQIADRMEAELYEAIARRLENPQDQTSVT
ncbi:hypothetical protein [Lysobacter enzymogenes]|uniref:hypothetical protein n=1 Tax=Lysobacter enzymogenes TaxID=69 RepID=UPI001A967E90|nr:hypothetical protein [Lysobacter enzymogenes]QQP96118.1 hypothetical protein JHW38_23385 [Lysobacter enzymogenes]